jgi:hypothetical protein
MSPPRLISDDPHSNPAVIRGVQPLIELFTIVTLVTRFAGGSVYVLQPAPSAARGQPTGRDFRNKTLAAHWNATLTGADFRGFPGTSILVLTQRLLADTMNCAL